MAHYLIVIVLNMELFMVNEVLLLPHNLLISNLILKLLFHAFSNLIMLNYHLFFILKFRKCHLGIVFLYHIILTKLIKLIKINKINKN